MTEKDYKLLEKRTKDLAQNQDDVASDEAHHDPGLQRHNTRKRNTGVTKDKVQFKRKIAKGPNPLSCKKRKAPPNPNPVSATKESKEGEDGAKRSRKRKRSRKTANES